MLAGYKTMHQGIRFVPSRGYILYPKIAGLAESVDVGDLKSPVQVACGFESRSPHQKGLKAFFQACVLIGNALLIINGNW